MRVKVEDEKIYLCKVKCQHVFFGIHSVNGHTDLSLIFHNILKLFTHTCMHVQNLWNWDWLDAGNFKF